MRPVLRIETNRENSAYWPEPALDAAECTDCMNLVQLLPESWCW